MRPQQKNRQRGRGQGGGNNNRGRNQNPLQRSYESNGPDLKVRGNAQQVADKYAQLARDATSSGDRVMAENYLQHAEHYNRIIIAAQAEQADQQRRRDEQRERDDRRRDDRRDERRSEREDRDESRRDDGRRDEARRDDDGDDRQDRRRRRRRDERVEADGRVDASEAPQPDVDMPIGRGATVEAEGNGADGGRDDGQPAERRPRRGRRTRPAPVEAAAVDGGATTGDSDAAGEAPTGAEDGLARTMTRTRRRRAPVDKAEKSPEPAAAGDAAE